MAWEQPYSRWTGTHRDQCVLHPVQWPKRRTDLLRSRKRQWPLSGHVILLTLWYQWSLFTKTQTTWQFCTKNSTVLTAVDALWLYSWALWNTTILLPDSKPVQRTCNPKWELMSQLVRWGETAQISIPRQEEKEDHDDDGPQQRPLKKSCWLCCRCKIPIRNHRIESKLAEHAAKEFETSCWLCVEQPWEICQLHVIQPQGNIRNIWHVFELPGNIRM